MNFILADSIFNIDAQLVTLNSWGFAAAAVTATADAAAAGSGDDDAADVGVAHDAANSEVWKLNVL